MTHLNISGVYERQLRELSRDKCEDDFSLSSQTTYEVYQNFDVQGEHQAALDIYDEEVTLANITFWNLQERSNKINNNCLSFRCTQFIWAAFRNCAKIGTWHLTHDRVIERL